MNMTEMMERAHGARSPEELLALARETGMELTEQDAEDIFGRFHKKGELSDEELDNVAGGACNTQLDGDDYVMVSPQQACTIGKYEDSSSVPPQMEVDCATLRALWAIAGADGACGRCRWLVFGGSNGYCGYGR